MKNLINYFLPAIISNLGKQRTTYLEVDDEQLQVVQREKGRITYQQTCRPTEIKACLAEAAYSPDQVSLLISSQQTFKRTLELPTAAKERLDEIIKFQFLDDLPCSREEVYYTYYPELVTEEQMKVLVFAVLKEHVDEVYQICSEHQLEITGILPVGLVYYLLHQQEWNGEKPVLFVDNNQSYYNYTFLAADALYLRANSQSDIESTLFYLSTEYDLEIDSLFAAHQDGIEEVDWIQVNEERPQEFWAAADKARQELTGREFIDLSESNRQQQTREIGILAVLFCLALSLNFGLYWQQQQQRLTNLEQKMKNIKPVVQRINQIRQKTKTIDQEIKTLEQVVTTNQAYLPWIKELENILGEEVVIRQLNFAGDKLALLAGTAPSASKVMTKLDQSPYFTNLNFSGSIVTQNNRERFKIVGELTNESK